MNGEVFTKTINTIRALSADMIQKANSGHPGLPLGAAPMAYTLWRRLLKHNPQNPGWLDRDRFVLSAGHGSALLYSLLHIFGYDLSMDDLKAFRQFGSRTPGHPELGVTPGVEISTGPLGQGVANAVGMALAENYLAHKFNRPGYKIVDHYTYALCGDGCLMEGISYEAASLAGTLKLSKLILLYDSNSITIEGGTDLTFCEDVRARFEALGWDTMLVKDGNDTDEIAQAISVAKVSDKPAFIEVKTEIGYGAPNKRGKASSHGEALGVEEVGLLKEFLGLDPGKSFDVPDEVYSDMKIFQEQSKDKENEWNALLDNYKNAFPELYEEWISWIDGKVDLECLDSDDFWNCDGKLATRAYSGRVLNKLADFVPNLIGGSADLGPSNMSIMKSRDYYSEENPGGSNLHFGVRELAMTALANGMAAHGGLRPYAAGFMVFSDYMKPGLRMAAMMGLPLISILTHDSIGVGEDGPTHQPVDQLPMLRSIPNMTVIRPCDSRETAAAWYLAMTRLQSPSAIILTRQAVQTYAETGKDALRGAYILKDSVKPDPDIIMIASGSEVELVYKAREILLEKGVDARVVSMPSMNIFEEQDEAYKQKVLPKHIRKRLVVEASSSFGWDKYAGLDGKIISVDIFGKSAPAKDLFAAYGFTVENVVDTAMTL